VKIFKVASWSWFEMNAFGSAARLIYAIRLILLFSILFTGLYFIFFYY